MMNLFILPAVRIILLCSYDIF
uniref:Uncharacterized protein n=1 Tax=Arundo donax TaxID=35708 RepID=A0A0A9AI78_ARUDO